MSIPVPIDESPLVLDAAGVAALIGLKSPATFLNKRRRLEADHNFPPKLPGRNAWSRPCVVRWIATNGESYMPTPRRLGELDEEAATIEARYAVPA